MRNHKRFLVTVVAAVVVGILSTIAVDAIMNRVVDEPGIGWQAASVLSAMPWTVDSRNNAKLAVQINDGFGNPAQSATATPESAETLTYGNSVKRTFSGDSGQFTFMFDANEGDMITLTMVAAKDTEVDPALFLVAPDGSMIAQNDDSLDSSFGYTNARLVNYPILTSGTYIIRASRSSSAGGDFTLSLRGTRTKPITDIPIAFGQIKKGTINDRELSITYQFHANEGDIISIVMQRVPGSTLAPYVFIANADGDKIVESDPAAETANIARISRFPIRSEGSYALVAGRIGERGGQTSGQFEITLTRDTHITLIKYGEAVEGAIDSNKFEVAYTFIAEPEDTVTAFLARTKGDLEMTISLIGPEGDLLSYDDSSDGRRNIQIEKFQIPEAGSYTILIGRIDGDKGTTTGSFKMSLKLETTR